MRPRQTLSQTPSQTIGPFFAYCLTPEPYGYPGLASNVLAGPDTPGQRIRVEGHVYDGEGAAVSDALVELWQANSGGRYAHPRDQRTEIVTDPGFSGFGRADTNERGYFFFETIKPGRVPGRGNTLQAPHLNLVVFARGMFNHLFTRAYFCDETDANAEDAVLGSVPEGRRPTIVARRSDGPAGARYVFDIRLQGENETVFFDA